jgi:hypothetical protein
MTAERHQIDVLRFRGGGDQFDHVRGCSGEMLFPKLRDYKV